MKYLSVIFVRVIIRDRVKEKGRWFIIRTSHYWRLPIAYAEFSFFQEKTLGGGGVS